MPSHARRERLYVPFESLTPKEQERCRQINLHLREIEAWAHARALAVAPDLRARVENPDDPMIDFETDLELALQLREDDPEYREDSDDECILARQTHALGNYKHPHDREPQCGIGDLEHHWREDRDPLRQAGEAPHCMSFHELRSLGYLSWRDVARIGRVFANFVVREQFFQNIGDGTAGKNDSWKDKQAADLDGLSDIPAWLRRHGDQS